MSKSSITIDAVKLAPVHPGVILSEELEAIGLSVSALPGGV